MCNMWGQLSCGHEEECRKVWLWVGLWVGLGLEFLGLDLSGLGYLGLGCLGLEYLECIECLEAGCLLFLW